MQWHLAYDLNLRVLKAGTGERDIAIVQQGVARGAGMDRQSCMRMQKAEGEIYSGINVYIDVYNILLTYKYLILLKSNILIKYGYLH